MPHGDASDSDGEYSYDLHINPDTGNPQTGKVIDEYLWLVPLLAVIAIGFVSLGNVGDVLQQVGQADSIRAPADRYEWTNLDNQDVRAPDCAASLLSGRSKTDRLPVLSVAKHKRTLVLQALQQRVHVQGRLYTPGHENGDAVQVYGPCGDAQSSSGAMQDLMEGRPCSPNEYRRVPTRTQMEYFAQ